MLTVSVFAAFCEVQSEKGVSTFPLSKSVTQAGIVSSVGARVMMVTTDPIILALEL